MPTKLAELPQDTPVSVANVRKIAIIGGGASGAITLDLLVQEHAFDEIVLFERRETVGGVWVLDEKPIDSPTHLLKPGALSRELDPPLPNPFRSGEVSGLIRLLRSQQERFEQTAAYSGMATNIVEHMMTFSDQRLWVDGADNKYVDRSVVHGYIDRYIQRHEHTENVRLVLGTTVEDVEKIHKDDGYYFRITLRQKLQDGTDNWYQENFDSLIVTVGHYHIPNIPAIPGLAEVQEKFPHVVKHAKFFRNAEPYRDKTILVVGSRALGADLTRFSADTATKVYQLIRSWNATRKLTTKENVIWKPVVERYELTDSGFNVIFEDGSVLENPDNVVYATGYQFSYPFLHREYGDLTLNGLVVDNVWQHTFWIDEPLISFVGIPTDSISFRAFEYQAILVARYLRGTVALPPRREQREWVAARLKEKGVSRQYHTIGAGAALEYMTELANIGYTKGPVGREFPAISQKDIEVYTAAQQELVKFWDEPRV